MNTFILLAVFVGALVASSIFIFGVLRLLFGSLVLRKWKEWTTKKPVARTPAKLPHPLTLTRTRHNPVLKQRANDWEAEAVLNPAAVDVDNRTHVFYRAIGNDGVSRLGYASASDGVSFDERLPYPVFAASDPRGIGRRETKYDPVQYPSGGSWGGVEDPRAVVIEDRLYMTYNTFDGWDYLRATVTSLSLDDLKAKRWNWATPRHLSPEGQPHKNYVLFPEKINGMFAFIHNLHGKQEDRVRIAYAKDLSMFDPKTIESPDPNGLPDRPRAWHKRMRSAGPPPVKTPFGWLLFYHATDQESHKYKMGALLLDERDPEKVLARSPMPTLTPDASYENEGKPGIVYACGATVKDGLLRVYYGGGDRVVCSATAHLSSFVLSLMHSKVPRLVTA